MTAGAWLDTTPAGIVLCALEAIADGGARNVVVGLRAGRFHGFLVRRGGEVFGYVDRCPHMGLPLAQRLDAYLTPDGGNIVCSWHGALFDIASGGCVGGPCAGASLQAWPVCVVGGKVETSSKVTAMPQTSSCAARVLATGLDAPVPLNRGLPKRGSKD